MNPSTKYIAIRNYREVFGDSLPDDDLKFIRRHPTDLLLLRLSKINAILFSEIDLEKQTASALEVLFPGMDPSPLFEIIDFENTTYFSAASITRLIKACLENFVEVDNDYSVHLSDLGLDILKSILIFNGRYFHDDPALKDDSFEGVFKLDLLQQNYIRSNVYQKMFAMVKFAFAAKYLAEAPDLQEVCREFCNHYQINNPWIFGKFFMSIYESILPKGQIGKHVMDLRGIPANMLSDFTIDRNALSKRKSLSVNMDIIPKPFYLLETDALVLDFDFFQYAIDQGFFYLLYKNTSLSKRGEFNTYNAFQGHIGLHFFEQYLVKKYLSAIFYRRYQKIISTERYQDFLIRASANKVLVIEVKNVSFHGKTLEDMDFKAFCRAIDQNFLASKCDGSKDKGLSQILRQIDNLIAEPSQIKQLLNIDSKKRLEIYPIIIYADSNFDISGVNSYVNERIESSISERRPGARSIMPVTLINVNVLIKYFSHLKQKPGQLPDHISGYFAYLRRNKKRYLKEGHLNDHYLANISFDGYLKRKVSGDHFKKNLPDMQKDFDLNIAPVL
jgi:hypothetical protein